MQNKSSMGALARSAWKRFRAIGAICAVLVSTSTGCTTKSEEATAHLCGSTFFNFQPQRLPPAMSQGDLTPPKHSELPPPGASKVYRLVLLLGTCSRGAVVTADPIDGIVVNRAVLARDGNVVALAITPMRNTLIRAWQAGRLVGAATLTPEGSLEPQSSATTPPRPDS